MGKLYFKEHEEWLNNYHLVVVFHNFSRCGYIGLPKGHKLENRDYDDFDFDVHGGLTFASNGFLFKDATHDWYFGFDCMHSNDGADIKTMIEHGATAHELSVAHMLDGEIRTKEYVLEELKKLVTEVESWNSKSDKK